MLHEPIAEARRQIEICNACRYCEGYCAVFPAITRQRAFADGDITQLANLCHNCRGCFYACQYTAPHEFDLNLPGVLADVRAESWETYTWPVPAARLFQSSGVAIAAALTAGLGLLFWAAKALPSEGGSGFYAVLSHTMMVSIFTPAFLLPLIVLAVAIRRYWRDVGGGPVKAVDVIDAAKDAAQAKNLSGGQGQGCNFEDEDRFTNTRRWLHQAVMWGFLLCFASTSAATVMHYAFGLEAPYGLFSLPKLFGIPGGVSLTVGCAGLATLKLKADPALGSKTRWGGEMGFILLLGFVAFSGLLLYAATGTGFVPALLAVHLGSVLAFFILLPYSKMVHGAFRFAALVRDAQTRSARP